MKTKQELREFYNSQVEQLTIDIQRLHRRNRWFVMAELTTFAMAVVCIAAYALWNGGNWSVGGALLSLVAYLLVRRMDMRNSLHTEEKENLHSVFAKELSYLAGDFSHFDNGKQYVDAHHAYTFDLDIFGSDSLFNRMNRTITTGGSNQLAAILADTNRKDISEIARRRKAIAELADNVEQRARFLALGQQSTIVTDDILASLRSARQTPIPHFANTRISLLLASAAIAAMLLLVVLAIMGIVSANIPVVWGLLQLFIVLMLCTRPIRLMTNVVGRIHSQLDAYIRLIAFIVDLKPKSSELAALVGQLKGKDTDAMSSFRELSRILNGIDRRGNILGMVIFNVFLLSDYFLVRRFLRWQDRSMDNISEWVTAVSHFDALVSMATFRYNEPEATDATFSDDDSVIYEARGLFHPFLGEKAVRNDFTMADGHYYIVTGANMAGKSTFLRSVGVNYVLATCGMPVFAQSFCVSVFSIFTSMRTTDDLSHGISYFNAELLRLQQLIESCRADHRTLIILDEILKGTNSLDKLNGSRLFLRAIAALPVTGIIATHDLELSKMEQEQPGRYHNYCFEIRLSDEITYTYRITPGTARNQNATHLLRNILKAGQLDA